MVGADADGDPAFLAHSRTSGVKRSRMRSSSAAYCSSVYSLTANFLLSAKLPGIDAHFFHPPGGFQRGVGLEVDVGHDGHVAAAFEQAALDKLQVARVLDRRGRDPHDLAADRREVHRLLDARLGVHRVAGDHRLDADRVVAADAHLADHDRAGAPAKRRERKRASGWMGVMTVGEQASLCQTRAESGRMAMIKRTETSVILRLHRRNQDHARL